VKNAKLLTQQKSASLNQCRYFTLPIAKRKVITDNYNIKPFRPSYLILRASVRLMNDSKKGRSYRWKTTTPWETTTPLIHRNCNDGVIQLSHALSSYAVLEFVEISHACFVHLVLQYSPTHFSQLDLNPANLEATLEPEWILAFLFLRKRHFQCHNHVILQIDR